MGEKSVSGELFMVRLSGGTGPDDPPCFTIAMEDDGQWFDLMTVNTHWMGELISLLKEAQSWA